MQFLEAPSAQELLGTAEMNHRIWLPQPVSCLLLAPRLWVFSSPRKKAIPSDGSRLQHSPAPARRSLCLPLWPAEREAALLDRSVPISKGAVSLSCLHLKPSSAAQRQLGGRGWPDPPGNAVCPACSTSCSMPLLSPSGAKGIAAKPQQRPPASQEAWQRQGSSLSRCVTLQSRAKQCH